MPDIGTSYKQHAPAGTWDAIVVGSGMGGLASAAILSRLGKKRVLVLERHYTAGGYTHAFHRPGYEWDVGVHYIGQVGARSQLKPFFDYVSNGKLEWAPLPDVYDRIVLGDRSYDLVTGAARFADRMKAYFPREERAIDRYLALIRKVGRRGMAYYGERALPASIARVAGPLMRLPYMRYASRTTADVLASLTDDLELRAVLAGQYGDYGLPPSQSSFAIHAAVVGHYLGGAWYPVGGAESIARTIEPVIAEHGGAIFVNADVAEIVVESGRATGVKMVDGRTIRAPIVISDAGIRLTHDRLLQKAPSPPAALRASVTEVGPSSAHACLYLGFRHTDAELGLTGTNLWIYPDRDHDRNIARYLEEPTAPLPLVYASFPSAKDPSFAARHPGRATIDLVTVAPWSRFSQWEGTRWRKRGADYDAQKHELAEKMLAALYTQVPQVRGKIDVQELSTPVTTKHFAAHPSGELYGLDHTPARYRMPLRAETHVKGLFLTGADLVSAGVAGALFGGVLTAAAILRKNVPGAIVAAGKRA
jgi:all-trans-retinol 13,14-reductase